MMKLFCSLKFISHFTPCASLFSSFCITLLCSGLQIKSVLTKKEKCFPVKQKQKKITDICPPPAHSLQSHFPQPDGIVQLVESLTKVPGPRFYIQSSHILSFLLLIQPLKGQSRLQQTTFINIVSLFFR